MRAHNLIRLVRHQRKQALQVWSRPKHDVEVCRDHAGEHTSCSKVGSQESEMVNVSVKREAL